MGQIWRQSEVTQFFASVGGVIDQKWSKRSRSEDNGIKYWKLRARKLTLHLINVAEINAQQN